MHLQSLFVTLITEIESAKDARKALVPEKKTAPEGTVLFKHLFNYPLLLALFALKPYRTS